MERANCLESIEEWVSLKRVIYRLREYRETRAVLSAVGDLNDRWFRNRKSYPNWFSPLSAIFGDVPLYIVASCSSSSLPFPPWLMSVLYLYIELQQQGWLINRFCLLHLHSLMHLATAIPIFPNRTSFLRQLPAIEKPLKWDTAVFTWWKCHSDSSALHYEIKLSRKPPPQLMNRREFPFPVSSGFWIWLL